MDTIVGIIIFEDNSKAPIRKLDMDNPYSNYIRTDEIPHHLQDAYTQFATNRACLKLPDGMSGNYIQDIKQFIAYQEHLKAS